jgi:hypothetical protein
MFFLFFDLRPFATPKNIFHFHRGFPGKLTQSLHFFRKKKSNTMVKISNKIHGNLLKFLKTKL